MKKSTVKSIAFAVAVCISALSWNVRGAEIATASDFVAVMSQDSAGSHALTADIDLADSAYTTVPNFTGTLDGQGHAITGLGAQSLFVTNAGHVANLTIDGAVSGVNTEWKADSTAGIFCVVCDGGDFVGCKVAGYTLRVSTTGYGGLFAGIAYEGSVFSSCSTDVGCVVRSATANATVGCFAGFLTCSVAEGTVASFVDCTNRAAILVTSGDYSARGKGGFVGKIDNVVSTSIPEVAFVRCVNAGTMSQSAKLSRLGGFVGTVGGNGEKQQDGIIRFVDCTNESDITASNSQSSCAAGFVAHASSISLEFSGCVNRGNILCAATAGGFVGEISGYGKSVGNGDIFLNSANYGNVTGTNNVGGLVGTVSWNEGYNRGQLHVRNCATYGTIETGEGGNKGQIIATASSGTSNGVIIEFTNIWAPTSVLYASSTKEPIVSCVQTADAEGYELSQACKALDAVAESTEGYERWCLGRVGGDLIAPELACFVMKHYIAGFSVFVR